MSCVAKPRRNVPLGSCPSARRERTASRLFLITAIGVDGWQADTSWLVHTKHRPMALELLLKDLRCSRSSAEARPWRPSTTSPTAAGVCATQCPSLSGTTILPSMRAISSSSCNAHFANKCECPFSPSNTHIVDSYPSPFTIACCPPSRPGLRFVDAHQYGGFRKEAQALLPRRAESLDYSLGYRHMVRPRQRTHYSRL